MWLRRGIYYGVGLLYLIPRKLAPDITASGLKETWFLLRVLPIQLQLASITGRIVDVPGRLDVLLQTAIIPFPQPLQHRLLLITLILVSMLDSRFLIQ
ncbi:hypothetical protein SDJN03_12588, partial [Cucurbita argyrosperma subsp. sororia]